MAKMIEKKSARILAFILAIIMIGSVLAYAVRGPSKPEEREIKFDMGENLNDWLKYVPSSTGYVLYYEYNRSINETLLKMIYNSTSDNIDPYVLRVFKPDFPYFKRMLVGYPTIYFIDVGRSKVYFTTQQKDEYRGYTVKLGNVFGKVFALVDEVHPVVLGYPSTVSAVVNLINGNGTSLADEYGNYTSKINGSFSYVRIISGDVATRNIQSNGTPMADFYFEGYRMNGTMFEKVVGIHFLGNYFFVESNKTEYYYCMNYGNGFSLAVMGDHNLTKLINTMPEMRSIVIKIGE